MILSREDCDEELKEKCTQDIKTAYEKIMKAYHDKENVYGMCHELKNKGVCLGRESSETP